MDFLQSIDVLILTRNEEANLARTLDALRRFPRVVVLDSGSTDATVQIAASNPNVRVCSREFDNHAAQWTHGLRDCGLTAPWVLALDADYVLDAALVDEIAALAPPPDVGGYRASFRYCIDGRALSGSLYPPVVILYRREGASYVQDGHTQRLIPVGRVEALRHAAAHDDRKPFSAWLVAQDRYARLECESLRKARMDRREVERPHPQAHRCRAVARAAVLPHARTRLARRPRRAPLRGAARHRGSDPERTSHRCGFQQAPEAVTLILGINAFHGDASACIVRDGGCSPPRRRSASGASSTGPGFPSQAIAYCLARSRARPRRRRPRGGQSATRAPTARASSAFALRQRPDAGAGASTGLRNRASARALDDDLRAGVSRAQRFASRSCTRRAPPRASGVGVPCLAVRRGGRASRSTASAISSSAAWGVGAGNRIDVDGRVHFPHSLGIFYQAHDAVPRLSALRRRVQGHGPRALRQAARTWTRCASIVQLQPDGAFRARPRLLPPSPRDDRHTQWDGGSPAGRRRCSRRALVRAARARARGRASRSSSGTSDIARSVQAMYEEAFFHLLERAARSDTARPTSRSPAAAR